jgi:hypothetical protein
MYRDKYQNLLNKYYLRKIFFLFRSEQCLPIPSPLVLKVVVVVVAYSLQKKSLRIEKKV